MTEKGKDVLVLSVDVRALAFRKSDCGVQEVYRNKKKQKKTDLGRHFFSFLLGDSVY